METVFSQVRNGRLKRVEDSLEKGFSIDTTDEHGNTALLVACQVRQTPACLQRREIVSKPVFLGATAGIYFLGLLYHLTRLPEAGFVKQWTGEGRLDSTPPRLSPKRVPLTPGSPKQKQ